MSKGSFEEVELLIKKVEHQHLEATKREEILNEIEQKIVNLKSDIREELRPDSSDEAERLQSFVEKVRTNLNVAFEQYDSVEAMKRFLEPLFQRGKKDKTYGRALILEEEKNLIQHLHNKVKNEEYQFEILNYIMEKAIELSGEVMPENYTKLLRLEHHYFKLLFS